MTSLFGTERLDRLTATVRPLTSAERKEAIVDALEQAIRDYGGRFTLSFEFANRAGVRTSHFVIFVTKHFRGYDIMREITASLSSDTGEVKRLRFGRAQTSLQMPLFGPNVEDPSIAALKNLLSSACAGSSGTVWAIYENHSVGTPYTLKNFKTALLELEREGVVTVVPPADKRPKRFGKPDPGR